MSHRITKGVFGLLSAVVTFAILTAGAGASDLKVFAAPGFKSALEELSAQYGDATGNRFVVETGPQQTIQQLLQRNEPYDVVLLSTNGIDSLLRQQLVVPESNKMIARSGMAVITSAGKFLPNVNSADAFKSILIKSKSIGYVDPSYGDASGIYIENLFQRLLISNEVKQNTRRFVSAHDLAQAVVSGSVEIGLTSVNAAASESGVRIAGQFPPGLQSYSSFSAAVAQTSQEPSAAEDFIEFLNSPAAGNIFRNKGMIPNTPPGPR
jgi:molybdenum ABC transporter molybdate-binding protein